MAISALTNFQTVTAKPTPDEESQIAAPDQSSANKILYYFIGDQSGELTLKSRKGDPEGEKIPADFTGPKGVYDPNSDARPKYLEAASKQDVTLFVVEGSNFLQIPIETGGTSCVCALSVPDGDQNIITQFGQNFQFPNISFESVGYSTNPYQVV